MTAEAAQTINEKSDNLTNKFEGLSVDEPSDAFLNAPDVARPEVVFEAESTMSARDAMFFLGLVLQDLIQIRLSIRGIWMRYAMGEYKLIAAGVASNTALDLARHIIDEAMPELEMQESGFYGVSKDHHILTCEFAKWMKSEEELKAFDLSPNPSVGEYKYVSGSWSYINAYNILCGLLPVMTNKAIGPIFRRDDQLESGKMCERYARDHDVLNHIFEDLLIIVEHIKMDWPVEDTLLRGLKEALQTGKIPFYLVFTSQIVLDVYHATEDLGGADGAMLDMFTAFNTIYKMFGRYYLVLRNTDMFEKMEEIDFKTRAVVKDTQELMGYIILKKKRDLMNRKSGKNIALTTTLEEHGLFKRHPIMCGLCLHTCQMVLYRSAVNGANATRSIVSTYHLYKALFTEGFLRARWADLEAIMRWIEPKDLFVGGRFPTEPEGYAKAFMLQLGFSAALFMDPLKRRGNSLGPYKLMRAAPLRLIPQEPPTMTAFVNRYMVNQGLAGPETWTTEDVHKIITEGEAEKPRKEVEMPTCKVLGVQNLQDRSSRKTKSKKWEAAREQIRKGKVRKGNLNEEKMTQKKTDGEKGNDLDEYSTLIGRLGDLLNEETHQVALPLLMVHSQCYYMMKAVRQYSLPYIEKILGPAVSNAEVDDIQMPGFVMWILKAYAIIPVVGSEMMRELAEIIKAITMAKVEPLVAKVKSGEEGDEEDDLYDGEWKQSELALMFYSRLGFPNPDGPII